MRKPSSAVAFRRESYRLFEREQVVRTPRSVARLSVWSYITKDRRAQISLSAGPRSPSVVRGLVWFRIGRRIRSMGQLTRSDRFGKDKAVLGEPRTRTAKGLLSGNLAMIDPSVAHCGPDGRV